jgi:hypothetical protein
MLKIIICLIAIIALISCQKEQQEECVGVEQRCAGLRSPQKPCCPPLFCEISKESLHDGPSFCSKKSENDCVLYNQFCGVKNSTVVKCCQGLKCLTSNTTGEDPTRGECVPNWFKE